jgi:hypothetical protein
MTAPGIRGLGHLDLTVTDGNRASRWWEQDMGFKLLARWEQPGYRGWTMIRASGLAVTAVTRDEGEADCLTNVASAFNVAFHVGDLAALKARANPSTPTVSLTQESRTMTEAEASPSSSSGTPTTSRSS